MECVCVRARDTYLLCKSAPHQFVKSKVVWDGDERQLLHAYLEKGGRDAEKLSDGRLSVRPSLPVILR